MASTPRAVRIAVLAATLAASVAAEAASGPTLAEAGADARLADLVAITKTGRPSEKGEGPVAHLARLEAPPARVALISFYVADTGKATGSYYASVRTFDWLTQDGASHFADRLHGQGIGPLRAAFAERGMRVLTPDEFLDSDAKRKAYLEFELEMSMAARLALGFIGQIAKGAASGKKLDQSAVAPGYRLLATHIVPTDPKMADRSTGRIRSRESSGSATSSTGTGRTGWTAACS